MDFKKIGMNFPTGTKTRIWWAKLAVALILSNVFFFYLCQGSSEETETQESSVSLAGMVEIQIMAKLLTPYQTHKKVLLVNRAHRISVSGVLTSVSENDQVTVAVNEEEANKVLQHDFWEVIPLIKNLTFKQTFKSEQHEIHY